MKTNNNLYFIDYDEKIRKTLVLTNSWDPSLKNIIERDKISYIRLSRSVGWKDSDISFLELLPFLRGIEIYADNINNINVINKFENLELIGIDSNLSEQIDFNNFKRLKICKIRWNNNFRNIFNVESLEHLNIINFPYEDFLNLSKLINLKRLQITSQKLKFLEGIKSLINLKVLDLYKCMKLEKLTDIEELKTIEIIEIEKCRRITNISELGTLKSLEKLIIEDCGDIETLNPLESCQNLYSIFIGGDTLIKDGDFHKILNLPKLKKFLFRNRKHYKYKNEEIKEFLNSKK